MTELKTRSYTDATGCRTTLRFDAATWRAIDLIAADHGLIWHQWVNGLPSEHENRHTDVRSALVAALIAPREQFERQALAPILTAAPLLVNAVTMDDSQLQSDLDEQLADDRVYDFGGFALRVGSRSGRPCLWVVNGMRGMRHVAVPIPEWVGQLGQLNSRGENEPT
jgi:predicted DNA-binding ribbon-helix-helix protein